MAMARKGVKVKELSRELGVTSRQIIHYCRRNGIRAQNSIARLSEQEAGQIRSRFASARPDRR